MMNEIFLLSLYLSISLISIIATQVIFFEMELEALKTEFKGVYRLLCERF